MELHVVSTGRQPFELWHDINMQIYNYVDYIHIREKNWPENKIASAVSRMLKDGIPPKKIVVNSHPRVTESFGLGGVHLSERMPICSFGQKDWRVGSSVHSVQMAEQKVKDGADYLFYGHIFRTNSKKGMAPRGLLALRKVAESVSCPVIAIGGITPTRVQECVNYQAKGIAVMSGIYEAVDPVERIKAYRQGLEGELDE